jgi:hypothetical protein
VAGQSHSISVRGGSQRHHMYLLLRLSCKACLCSHSSRGAQRWVKIDGKDGRGRGARARDCACSPCHLPPQTPGAACPPSCWCQTQCRHRVCLYSQQRQNPPVLPLLLLPGSTPACCCCCQTPAGAAVLLLHACTAPAPGPTPAAGRRHNGMGKGVVWVWL